MKFYVTEGDCGCSSLYQPKNLGNYTEIIVPVFRLDTFLQMLPWDRFEYIEYIKIDAQGADLNILKGAGKYLERVVYVTAEAETYHYHDTINTEQNINLFMISNGFARVYHKLTSDPTYLNNKYKHLSDIYIEQL